MIKKIYLQSYDHGTWISGSFDTVFSIFGYIFNNCLNNWFWELQITSSLFVQRHFLLICIFVCFLNLIFNFTSCIFQCILWWYSCFDFFPHSVDWKEGVLWNLFIWSLKYLYFLIFFDQLYTWSTFRSYGQLNCVPLSFVGK